MDRLPTMFTALLATSFGLASPAQAQTLAPLPAIELRLRCFDNSANETAAEIEHIVDLHAFAREHDGQVVWLDAVLTADAGAGNCSRDIETFPDQPAPTGERARITFHPCEAARSRRPCRSDETEVAIVANGPPLAFTHSVYLPQQDGLPTDLPYRNGGYGDWLNYQGPFIVRYFEGTGYAYATFTVPAAALPGVWDRAACNRRPESC